MRTLLPGVEERDYAKSPLSPAEVRAIVSAAGSVGAVLNTRHATAQRGNWGESPPATEVFVEAVVAEPNLLRRPIVLDGDRVVVGKNATAYRALAK